MTTTDGTTQEIQGLGHTPIERLRDRVLVLLFALGLAFPPVAQLAGWGNTWSGTEKRQLAEFPTFAPDKEVRASVAEEGGGVFEAWRQSIDRWPRSYEAWFNDHFAYRASLIRLHHREYIQGLGVSPRDDVVMGKQGWLFTNGSDQGQAALDQVRGMFPFSEAQLREWQRFLEELRDWFGDRGVPYYVTFAPSKPSIHPEFLPPGLAGKQPVTRLDQLQDWMADTQRRDGHAAVPLIDMRPDLLAAKKTLGILYRRTDTHWNAAGALIACATVVDRLRQDFPELEPIVPSEFTMEPFPAGGGDLAAILNLADVLDDELIRCKNPNPIDFTREVDGMVPVRIPGTAVGQEENLAEERRHPFRFVQDRDDLPRLLMFRDSATSAMVPFISRAFSSTSFYWQYRIHDPAIMARERPDLVLQEIGERILVRNQGLPHNERYIVEDLDRRQAFRASSNSLDSTSGAQQGSSVMSLGLEGLPLGQDVMVRVAGDFPEGGKVHISLRSPGAGIESKTLRDKDLIHWRDVVYARARNPRPNQSIRIDVDAPGARDVQAEARAVAPLDAAEEAH